MRVRLTQIDGKLPNLALMSLAYFHRQRGDEVHFSRRIEPELFEPDYDRVYASAIFTFSRARLDRFRQQWPDAIIGGTGSSETVTVEQITGQNRVEYDYSIYPDYEPSIGFTQRGCRLKCKFCVVPTKEGKNRADREIDDIWRGEGHPKKLHLLDNDFFGQPREDWQRKIGDIRSGGFRICLNQGINVRLIDDEAAEALASVEYRDDSFSQRRLYTAWDNLKDEKVFFRGIDTLERAGIPPKHVMAYMLVGFDPKETWERIMYRFEAMVERGVAPYPMVFNNERRDLKAFQRWAVTGLYRAVPWQDYQGTKSKEQIERATADAPLLAIQGANVTSLGA